MHEFRIATIDDALAIAEFQTAAWNDAYRDLVPAEYLERMTVSTRMERWGDRIRAAARSIILAEREGTIEGVVSFEETDGQLELMSLYIAPKVRGTGLGSRLLTIAVGGSPAALCVFRDNDRAIRFYQRHGFEPAGHESIDPDTGLALVRMARYSGDT